MKPSNIAAIAGIAVAGIAVYFVVRKLQGAGETISDIAGKVFEEAKVIGKTIAAGPGAVLDDNGDRVPVADQLKTSGGIGLKATVGAYLPATTRNALTGGSMLLSDAEKAALRAADSGAPPAQAATIYGLFNQNDFNRIDGFLADSYNPNTAAFNLN